MRFCTTTGFAAAGLVLSLAGVAPGAQANVADFVDTVLHDEFLVSDGPLSSDPASPTFLGILESDVPEDVLFSAPNLVRGSLNAPGTQDTQDYFSFTVGPEQTLNAIDLFVFDDLSTTPFNDAPRGFFVLFGPGDTVADPAAENFGSNIGGAVFDPPIFDTDLNGANADGTDFVIAGLEPINLLDSIVAGGATLGSGFDPETGLGPGTYTLLIGLEAELVGEPVGTANIEYEISLVTQVIPEPASLALLSLGALAALGRRRGR